MDPENSGGVKGFKKINYDEPLWDKEMDSLFDKEEVVVIDNGSETIKVGFAGEDYPRLILPSIIGVPSEKNDDITSNKIPMIYGKDERLKSESQYKLSYPIKNGALDPADLEYLTQYWFEIIEGKLKLDITQVNLMVIDSPIAEKQSRNSIADKFFDQFKISSITFMNSSTLALFATGRTRGLVVESGHGASYVSPIFEGFPLAHAMHTSNIAGEEIGKQLMKELNDRGIKIDKTAIERLEIIKYLKEKMCAVALDFDKSLKGGDPLSEDDRSYELPDGNTVGGSNIIQVDHKARFTATEILFKPSIIGQSCMSLTEMMLDSFDRIDPDLKTELYKNIVLCGGTSLLPGFPDRIRKEIFQNAPKEISRNDIVITADSQRKYAAWIGGSMIGSLSTFQERSVKKSEYEENQEAKTYIMFKNTF